MPKITKTAIENAQIPAEGDLFLWDSELQGFGVRIQSSGRKTYMVRYRRRSDGKQRKMNLCRVSDATPDKARGLARDVFLAVAAGNDPQGERTAAKEKPASTITIEQMFKARIAYMRGKGLAMTDHVERVLMKAGHNAADFWGRDRAPDSITPNDVIDFVSKHFKEGKRGAADKARSYLSATFAWAITSANDYTVTDRQDWGLKVNPVTAVAKDTGAKTVRNRNLSPEEIKKIWEGCSEGQLGFSEGTEILLKMLIACGQRVLETLRIEGKDLDLASRLWIMPKEKTKGNEHEHVVPLPEIIMPELKRLKALYGDGFLFQPRVDSKEDHLGAISVSHAVRRAFGGDGFKQVIFGMEAFTPRDLRRTWKSRTGDGPRILKEHRDLIQQHAKNDTSNKHYDRADYLPEKREAMDKWNAWLMNLINPQKPNLSVAA